MATRINDDWDMVVDTTYTVVEEQLGRGVAFDRTLARTIQVSGLFEVNKKLDNSMNLKYILQ